MKVCVETGKDILKVVESLRFSPDFALIYTTENRDCEIVKELKDLLKCPFIGCYTEGIISDGKLKKGAGVMAIKGVKAVTKTTLSPEKAKNISTLNKGTVIAFTGWMNKRISNSLRVLYNNLGYSFRYVGGCSGKFREFSFHFTDGGCGEREMCIAGINVRTKTSFDHGWERFSGPYIMTRFSENKIYELDGKNAVEVYCKVTSCCEDLEECRKVYPFGFLCACGKYILRAPIDFKDGIEVLSEVPNSSATVIMSCEEEDVINAAENAARNVTDLDKLRFALIFNCVSRKQYLGKNFKQEIKIFEEVFDVPYLGMLSVGEFVSTEKICVPNFHNKTVVVSGGFA